MPSIKIQPSKKENIRKFYENQHKLINGQREDTEYLNRNGEDERLHEDERAQTEKVWDTRLSILTILLNVVLIAAKITAAVYSNSLSVLASVVDSLMDIVSGLIIWWTCRNIEKINKRVYPVGLDRLEPLTVLIVGMIMIFANVLVVEEAISKTISNELSMELGILTIVTLITGTLIKFVLYLICRSRSSSSAKCLAIDQRNDCLTNLVALAGAFIGTKWWDYADPLGALLVSGFIMVTWFGTVREQIPLLIGRSADPQFINRITNIAISHDARIKYIDTIHVYHFGANFLVELHVVMDKDLPLYLAHDVSEGLQCKLERLPFVQRAFVHCDYIFDGDEHI